MAWVFGRLRKERPRILVTFDFLFGEHRLQDLRLIDCPDRKYTENATQLNDQLACRSYITKEIVIK